MPVTESAKLELSDELLHRQVHPNLYQRGRPWSGVFTPTAKDAGHLSADREKIVSAREAYERYLKLKKISQSGGVWGVTIQEFSDTGLSCYSDPITDNGDLNNAAHVLIDFSGMNKENADKCGKVLYAKAIARGMLYPGES